MVETVFFIFSKNTDRRKAVESFSGDAIMLLLVKSHSYLSLINEVASDFLLNHLS